MAPQKSKRTSGSEITQKPPVGKVKKKRTQTANSDLVVNNNAKFVGAHVSIAGGISKAVENALAVGAKSFGLFLKSQRQWNSKPMDSNEALLFRKKCAEHNFPPHLILPHGSYLLNCGSPNEETLEKSRNGLIDELRRCEALGLSLFNFHPGSTCGKIPRDECIKLIAESINKAHAVTSGVTTVIENMSRQGNTIGGDFKELAAIIDLTADKSRIGVCLDTCHAFASGYDIAERRGYDQMMDDFGDIVGFRYLKALHLNDSRGKVGSHLDRHENIGKGQIGLKGFEFVMNDSRFNNLPMILETPLNVGYEKEIDILYKLYRK